MNSDQTGASIDRRHFIAAGAGGIAALSAGVKMAAAGPPPGLDEQPPTNSRTGVRTAVITDAQLNIGPFLARKFAKLRYNLVIADVRKGLPDELRSLGATKVVIVPGLEQEGPNNESKPGSLQRVVDAAMSEFGGFDSAFIRTAIHAPQGDVLHCDADCLYTHYEQNCLAVMYGLQAVLPPLMDAGQGPVLILTSASAVRPYYDFLGYTAMRAAANQAIQAAAMSAAPKGVCVNAFGTNFLNYPDAVNSYGGKDKMAAVAERIPVGRFGEPEEMAHVATTFLDGKNMFTSGQEIMIAGGYNRALDSVKPPA